MTRAPRGCNPSAHVYRYLLDFRVRDDIHADNTGELVVRIFRS